MTAIAPAGPDELSAGDKVVKFLVRAMRDGKGMSVEDAATELVEEARDRALERAERVEAELDTLRERRREQAGSA